MSECVLDLANLKMEHRDYFVLYASKDRIIYRDKQQLVVKSCDDQVLSQISMPNLFSHYEFTSLGNNLVFILGGKYLFYYDGFSDVLIEELPLQKVGKFLSHIYPSDHENGIITINHLHGRVHFMIYDILKKKRLFQSSSWEVSQINNVVALEDKIYCLMDNSYVVCCDKSTCETIWTRFETGVISPQIIPYRDGIIYCCNGLLKVVVDKKVETIHIPLARPSTLECLVGNKLFYTCNGRKNICCYDLEKKELVWEISGTDSITQSLLVKGSFEKNQSDVLLSHTSNALTVINLSLGKVHSHFRIPEIKNIKLTRDHVLVHKQFNYTGILAG